MPAVAHPRNHGHTHTDSDCEQGVDRIVDQRLLPGDLAVHETLRVIMKAEAVANIPITIKTVISRKCRQKYREECVRVAGGGAPESL